MRRELAEAIRSIKAIYLILGLSGYTDAGWVASFSSDYVVKEMQATELGEMGGGGFVYLSTRPTTVIKRGLVEKVKYPSWKVYFADRGSVLVVKGEEPHFGWEAFLDEVMELAEAACIEEVYAIGGLIDMVEEPRVSAVVSLPELQGLVEAHRVDLIDYEGPCSIYTALLLRCGERGVRAVSLWGHVPYKRYTVLSQLRAPDLETSYKVLTALCELSKLKLPLERLRVEAERQLSFLEGVRMIEEGGRGPSKFNNYIY